MALRVLVRTVATDLATNHEIERVLGVTDWCSVFQVIAAVVAVATAWVTSTQVAERTGLSPRYIRDEIREGRLAAVKFGRRGGRGTYRIPADIAEGYIKRMLGALYNSCEAIRKAS